MNQCNMQYLSYYLLLSLFILVSSASSSFIRLYTRTFFILLIDVARETNYWEFSHSSLLLFKKLTASKSCSVNLLRVSVLIYTMTEYSLRTNCWSKNKCTVYVKIFVFSIVNLPFMIILEEIYDSHMPGQNIIIFSRFD